MGRLPLLAEKGTHEVVRLPEGDQPPGQVTGQEVWDGSASLVIA